MVWVEVCAVIRVVIRGCACLFREALLCRGSIRRAVKLNYQWRRVALRI